MKLMETGCRERFPSVKHYVNIKDIRFWPLYVQIRPLDSGDADVLWKNATEGRWGGGGEWREVTLLNKNCPWRCRIIERIIKRNWGEIANYPWLTQGAVRRPGRWELQGSWWGMKNYFVTGFALFVCKLIIILPFIILFPFSFTSRKQEHIPSLWNKQPSFYRPYSIVLRFIFFYTIFLKVKSQGLKKVEKVPTSIEEKCSLILSCPEIRLICVCLLAGSFIYRSWKARPS